MVMIDPNYYASGGTNTDMQSKFYGKMAMGSKECNKLRTEWRKICRNRGVKSLSRVYRMLTRKMYGTGEEKAT